MKKILVFLVIGVTIFAVSSCGKENSTSVETEPFTESEETYSEISWPDSDIAKLLPVPKSSIGRIEWEASYGFVIYVAETPESEYDAYVDLCRESGFDINYRSGDDYYYADNEEGYHLSLNYKGNDVMFIRIDEPNENEITEEFEEEQIETSTEPQEEPLEHIDEQETSENGIRPEFKEAMDSYEAFFDEYCEFMKKYTDSDNAVSMLDDYTDYMTKYTDTMTKLSELDDGELSNEELVYYAEVMTRITKKLTEIG